MAVKPGTTPQIWASNVNWATGPFIGSATKANPGGAASDGHRAGSNFPTAAEHENYQHHWLTRWVVDWTSQGNALGTADAHPLETNAAGRTAATGLTLNDGVDETVLVVLGVNTLAPTVDATCTTGAVVFNAQIGNSTGTGFAAAVNTGAGAGFFASLFGTPAGGAGFRATADAASAGHAVSVSHAGTGAGVNVSHTGSGLAGSFVASALAASGTLIAGAASQSLNVIANGALRAIEAVGSNAAGSVSVRGRTIHADGIAFDVSLGGGPSVNARGYRASVGGSAIAAEFSATGGYALLVAGDPTAPQFAEVKFVGQNARPAVDFDGALSWMSAERQFVRSSAGNGYRGLWDTGGGYCRAFAFIAPPTTATAAYQTAVTAAMSGDEAPKFLGGTEVTLKFTPRTTTAAVNAINYRVIDVTAGTTIYTRSGTGTGATAGVEVPASTSWQPSVSVSFDYPLPAVGNRTFRLEVASATGTNIQVRDASLEVTGVY